MFFRADRTPPDALAVLRASGLLAVSEFRVFELAHVNWYGFEADERTIERHFFPYMFREEVPHFVRAFTRKILGLERAGRLDPEEFGIEPDERTVRGVVSGVFYGLGIAAALAVLVALAKVTAESLGFAECMFPPCF